MNDLLDEKILNETLDFLKYIDISESEQNPEKLLREIDEDEYEIVTDILDNLGPEELAFNRLFAGKNRLVINFPTMDNQSELGQFAEKLKNVLELTVDWEKGMVSAQREWTENSIENDESFVGSLLDRAPPQKKANKKFQMKIGKYFMKVDKLLREFKEMRQIVAKHVYEDRATAAGYSVAFSVGQIREAFTTEQLKRYYQLMNGLELYVGFTSMGGLNKFYTGYEEAQKGIHTKMPQLAKYWQENAGYIKNNIGELTNDKYSIILTRSPIDVMRMSDFNKITSCHSPPSRGNTSTSYYKCAVAEAHGHGAIAYVVPTEELLEQTDSSDLQEAENAIQEGEIFDDEIRGSHIGIGLTPVSRGRLRQVRYYDTDRPKRYDEGIEVAMPEKRVYGANIPGFMERVLAWARENQTEVIESMPKENGKIDLNKFMIFGGSYEDTANAAGRRALMSKLLGINHFDDLVGSMKQNTATEDVLDHDAISGMGERWEQEIEAATEEWNQRYAIVRVEGDVEDDGDGGLYIAARAVARIPISKDDFVKTPNSYPTAMHAFDNITDLFGDIFLVDNAFINYEGENLIFGCDLNLEHPDIGESSLMYSPEDFNEFCRVLDVNIDDKHDAFTAYITEFLKREGWLKGAAYVQLVNDIDNHDLSSYEWDVRTDGEYPADSYESTASTSHDFNPEALGINPKVLVDILNSTGWRVMIRQELLKPAKDEFGTSSNVDLNGTTATQSGEDITYEIEFIVNTDAPDEVIELFRELVTGDMDDEDRLNNIFEWAMKQTLNARLPSSQQQNLDEHLVSIWKDYLKV